MQASDPDFLAEAQGVSKAYPGVLAVDQVSLTLQSGEIHGIVGENGAGKTTLMKILAGLTQPDEGRLMVKGEPATFGSPGDAIHAGIGMVQQHFTLVPTMTVAENIALAEGQLESGKRRGLLPLDFRQLETKVQKLSDTYHLAVSPAGRIEDFSVGVQQRVELLRTLYLSTEVLILDEPTAVLTPSEIRGLMKTLRKLTADGRGIFFVSHHLQEVLDFTDRISVMRGGRLIDTVKSSEASKSLLARMMIGRLVSGPEQVGEERKPTSDGTVKLEVRDLWVRGEKKTYAVEGVCGLVSCPVKHAIDKPMQLFLNKAERVVKTPHQLRRRHVGIDGGLQIGHTLGQAQHELALVDVFRDVDEFFEKCHSGTQRSFFVVGFLLFTSAACACQVST